MSSLVLELQRAALDPQTTVSSLLRRALVVAKKLNLSEFETWIQSELCGYSEQEKIPKYRIVSGQPVRFNSFRGDWQALLTRGFEPEEVRRLRTQYLPYPIAEIEGDLRGGDNSFFILTYSQEAEQVLMQGLSVPAKIGVRYERSQFEGVLQAVRDVVLEWSLKLEQDGVLGEGMSFSADEKYAAASGGFSITNDIHQVSDSQVQLGADHSVLTMTVQPLDLQLVREVIRELRDGLHQSGLAKEQQARLLADVGSVEAQLSSPSPRDSIVRECLRSVRNILEGAGGSGLATVVLPHITALLKLG